ncbi:MAG TPA: response regulator [Gemmatimonadaceae bacterium]|jgi:two-component system chemotaxis response regulator CheY|nr:response regulator [Gemmatimonadaceae bacterium]
MKFLVVDDSVTMRRVIVNTLQRIGYTDAIEATDGDDALGQFNESVGFIITDWNMPRMSGVEFARAVRATPAGASVPILMVTTRGAREDITEAVEAGVNHYVLKPFTPTLLKQKIDLLTGTESAA